MQQIAGHNDTSGVAVAPEPVARLYTPSIADGQRGEKVPAEPGIAALITTQHQTSGKIRQQLQDSSSEACQTMALVLQRHRRAIMRR